MYSSSFWLFTAALSCVHLSPSSSPEVIPGREAKKKLLRIRVCHAKRNFQGIKIPESNYLRMCEDTQPKPTTAKADSLS